MYIYIHVRERERIEREIGGERGWKEVANRRGGVGRAAAIAALTGRHLSGAVAARACFRSTGADSGPSIGRSSLFLYVWRGVRCVRWLPLFPSPFSSPEPKRPTRFPPPPARTHLITTNNLLGPSRIRPRPRTHRCSGG